MPDLERLKDQYPRWSIWRGGTTREYWAMPPRDHPSAYMLLTAYDLVELARQLAAAEGARQPAE